MQSNRINQHNFTNTVLDCGIPQGSKGHTYIHGHVCIIYHTNLFIDSDFTTNCMLTIRIILFLFIYFESSTFLNLLYCFIIDFSFKTEGPSFQKSYRDPPSLSTSISQGWKSIGWALLLSGSSPVLTPLVIKHCVCLLINLLLFMVSIFSLAYTALLRDKTL